jgi:hypothetical protein
MKYTVIWLKKAEDQLARLWTDASDRAAVTAAADTIDSLLRWRPAERGESRSERSRILIEGVLAVLFEINEEDRLVYVTAVKRCR